ncbi:hypothetical protein C0Q70_10979 [Pomacea canaliculata]|uniref:RWD domain-containing protein n=1 Tax=Pomacea canaliculata TaxID=400727 RepID=A0A2T7P4P7_POMCA|nr:hypothetical protein C0Q70_10979 [Pomacea canaliculata]
MTDYAEEQRNEIEALMSIYPEELQIVQDSPHFVFQLTVSSSESEEPKDPENENDIDDRVTCVIQFTYAPTYPDEPPLIEIISSEKMDDEQQTKVLDFINEQVQENLGIVMVFTIVSALQEKLTVMVEDAKRLAEEQRIQKEKDDEEAALKKFEGTRVTIESFLAWKAKFDAERKERKRIQEEGVEVDESLFEDMEDLDIDDADDDEDPDWEPDKN